MSHSNFFDRLLEDARRKKFLFVRLLILLILVAIIHEHPLEELITDILSPAMGPIAASYAHVLLLVPLVILLAYFAYRIYVDLSTLIIEASLARLKMRSTASPVLILNKIFGLVLLITIVIWALSGKFPFLVGYSEAIIGSFGGLFSLLITLILAMQMREVGGNFLAGMFLRTSNVVDEGDYIKIDAEYVRVEKIDHTYTHVLNILGERIFVPNLKFLTDTFRKPFSKETSEYVDLRFDTDYDYSPKQVEQDMSDLVNQYNQTPKRSVKIDEFKVVTVDLAPYSVIYALLLKPSAPIFPDAIRNDFRRLLHEKYGEDLATPMMLNIRK